MIAQHFMRLTAIHDETGRLTIENEAGKPVALSAEQFHINDLRALFRLFSLSPTMWCVLHIAKYAMAHAAGALLDNPARPDGSYAHLMQAKEHVERVLAEAGGEAPARQPQDIRDALAVIAGEIVYGDGTEASQQRAIDYSVAALKVHGITREVWARALAGEPRQTAPAPVASGDALAALRLAESFMAGFEDDETQEGVPSTLAAIRAAIAAAEGRETADAPKGEPPPVDFEKRQDGGLIAFLPVSSAARQWSIDNTPKGASWQHARWYTQRGEPARELLRLLVAEGFTVREA